MSFFNGQKHFQLCDPMKKKSSDRYIHILCTYYTTLLLYNIIYIYMYTRLDHSFMQAIEGDNKTIGDFFFIFIKGIVYSYTCVASGSPRTTLLCRYIQYETSSLLKK